MTEEKEVLEQLVAEATVLLRETEANLEKLAQIAFAAFEESRAVGVNGRHPTVEPATARLLQIGQQLAKLSQRSNTLQTYLQNGLESPPTNDDHWTQIKILQSQEEERSQLARELEDSVGQLLANAVFELASSRHLLGANDTAAVSVGLDALQRELEQGLADIRSVITDLEPAAILSNFGLGGGIRRYLEQYEARTNLHTELRINTNLGRLPNTIEVAIFRVIQEALQNVHHHANATRVEVVFEENHGCFEFSVIDNGEGMASDRVDISKKNFGLARMVDYADLINGQLRVFSEPNRGTHVLLAVPYQIF